MFVSTPPEFDPPANSPLGGLVGVTLSLALLAELVPAALVAVTVKVTALSLVRLVTVKGELLPEAVCPLEAVAVKDVTSKPPVLALALNATMT
jgi:hypothetical protein